MSTAVIDLRPPQLGTSLPRRLRDARGFGLVELLIALLVLNVGIFATISAFTSGASALRRASHVSTASAIADKKMEALRDTPYAGIVAQAATLEPSAPDGRQYTVEVGVQQASQKPGVLYPGTSTVKVVTVTVRDVADGNKVLVQSSSTFEQCAQDRNSTACGG